MNEIWGDIVGFEDRYQVSTHGRIKKLNPDGEDKIFIPATNNKGYNSIKIYREDLTYKNFLVHRLVAMAFIPNPDNLPQVDHLDRDRNNNYVDNLKWSTCSQNVKNRGFSNRYTGVYKRKNNKWMASIKLGKRLHYLGYYNCELSAALAFDRYVMENNLDRELNFPQEEYLEECYGRHE